MSNERKYAPLFFFQNTSTNTNTLIPIERSENTMRSAVFSVGHPHPSTPVVSLFRYIALGRCCPSTASLLHGFLLLSFSAPFKICSFAVHPNAQTTVWLKRVCATHCCSPWCDDCIAHLHATQHHGCERCNLCPITCEEKERKKSPFGKPRSAQRTRFQAQETALSAVS